MMTLTRPSEHSPVLDSGSNADATPESIRPLPRLQVTSLRSGRKKGRSMIVTSTPDKNQEQQKQQKEHTNLPSTDFLASRVSKGTTAGTSGISLTTVENSEEEFDARKVTE